ncbi:MAG: hypothetical protein LC101_07885 [Flavobacteriales bacterium]|nr:hypothetical protein [Flavobacteriales bacterium]
MRISNSIVFIFFLGCLSPKSWAQKTIFSFPDLPVEMDYPDEFTMERTGKRSWVLYDKNVGTEFNINLYKVSPRFNSDSLRYLMLRIYEDPSIKNLQVSESGSGSMGPYRAEKLVLSFMTENDKRYLSTIYLVYFHLNQSINCLLFYFEIGENNVISYAPVQEDMISSLRYKPFKYKKYTHDGDVRMSIDYPDFWSFSKMPDTLHFLSIHDGRGEVRFSRLLADSTSLSTRANWERDAWRKNTSAYPGIKIKTQSFKDKNGAVYYQNTGSYEVELFPGFKRVMDFKKFFIRRIDNTQKYDYEIIWVYPQQNEGYYTPVMDIMMESLNLPGQPEIIEKK